MTADEQPPQNQPATEPAEPPVAGESPGATAVSLEERRTLEVGDLFLQDLKHPDTEQILLPAGTTLNEGYIRKILNLGLLGAALACLRPAMDRRIEALELSRGLPFEYVMYLEGKRIIETVGDCVRPNVLQEQREHLWGRATTWVTRMVDLLVTRDLDLYADYRIYDAYRHSHPLNTAIISILIGEGLKMKRDRLIEMGISGFMADIGKLRVPFGILNKPGRLTPEELEEARAHVEHSKAIVESFRWAAGDVVNAALHHHERYDGTGYPKQLAKRMIGEGARIVGLADAYDAMLSDVPYRPRMEPAVAYRLVTMSTGFDPFVIMAFKKRVTPYPRGLQVKLNNGKEGTVSRPSAENPFRPTLIVENDEIDLAADPSLRITGQFVPRRYHRTAVMLPVRVRSQTAPECTGVAINISLAGLCVESEHVPPQGEALGISLPVLGRDQGVDLTGYLAWVRRGEDEKTSYGLSIEPDSPEDRMLLVDLILGLP